MRTITDETLRKSNEVAENMTCMIDKYFDRDNMFDFFTINQKIYAEMLMLCTYQRKAECGSKAEKKANRNLTRKLLYCNKMAKLANLGFMNEFIPIADDKVCEEIFNGFWAAAFEFEDYAKMSNLNLLRNVLNAVFAS